MPDSKHARNSQDRRSGDSAVRHTGVARMVVLRRFQLELSAVEEPGEVACLENRRRSTGSRIVAHRRKPRHQLWHLRRSRGTHQPRNRMHFRCGEPSSCVPRAFQLFRNRGLRGRRACGCTGWAGLRGGAADHSGIFRRRRICSSGVNARFRCGLRFVKPVRFRAAPRLRDLRERIPGPAG